MTPHPPALDLAEPLLDDGSCPADWRPVLGRYRCHSPWQPTFLIAARAGELVLGTDWMESQRLLLTPLDDRRLSRRRAGVVTGTSALRHAPIDGRPHRATWSGMPYYRAFGS